MPVGRDEFEFYGSVTSKCACGHNKTQEAAANNHLVDKGKSSTQSKQILYA